MLCATDSLTGRPAALRWALQRGAGDCCRLSAQTVNFATADAPAAFSNKTEPVFTGEWAVK